MTFSQIAAGVTSPPRAPSPAKPLVSVVIPCYNAARYLAETIETVLAQTYPRIEVIVVDDGSSDATSRIAHSYPVTYLYQPNRGISAARNNGFFRSQGKYVLFLDHDDRLLPRAIEIGVDLLEEHPECAIAVGEHRYIAADGTELGCSNKQAAGRDPYEMLLEHNFIETPCSALHRRSCFALVGAFRENLQGAEDYELYLRTARQSALITHEEPVAEYRLHQSSISRNAERMLTVSHRVLQMELPHLQGDPSRLRLQRRGVRFIERHFGRRLTRELIAGGWPMGEESRRKLALLRRHYKVGYAAVIASRFLPAQLLKILVDARGGASRPLVALTSSTG